MKLANLSVALFLLVPSAAIAQGSTITTDGIARSVSLFLFVGTVCPSYLKVNTDLAGRYSRAEETVGDKIVGEQAFNGLMAAEVQRRRKEIDATGAQMWCTYQKANLSSLGLKAMMD